VRLFSQDAAEERAYTLEASGGHGSAISKFSQIIDPERSFPRHLISDERPFRGLIARARSARNHTRASAKRLIRPALSARAGAVASARVGLIKSESHDPCYARESRLAKLRPRFPRRAGFIEGALPSAGRAESPAPSSIIPRESASGLKRGGCPPRAADRSLPKA